MSSFKLLNDFHQLNRNNLKQCAAAYRTYIDLSQAKHMLDVNYHYNKSLEIVYLSGRNTNISYGEEDIYIPIVSSDDFNFDHLEKYQNILSQKEYKSIIISIVDPSGIILYYKFTNTFLDLAAD